ncbi:MAG: hemolysin family protein [Herpetosiphon sp.]
MDPYNWYWLLGVVVCLVIAAIAAAADAALTAISRHRLNTLVVKGGSRARIVVTLLQDPVRFKATTLTLNTMASGVATALTLGAVYPWRHAWVPLLALACLIVLFLTLGQALPKALATINPDRTALIFGPVLNIVARIILPLLALVHLVVRPFVRNTSGHVLVSEEELKMLVNVGEEEGVIERDEREMIEGILVFGDTLVREVMVPRVDIVVLSSIATVAEALDVTMAAGHSRIPVYLDTIDNIIGILYVRDMLPLLRDGHLQRKIMDVLRPVYYVPETMKVDDLLRNLKTRKVHMALVVDEYGGTAGLATIEDVLEEIVGEIQDEYDREEPSIDRVNPHTWIVDARLSLDDLNAETGLSLLTEEVDTLGGLVYEKLGSIPHVGDVVSMGDVTITVRSVQGLRPGKLEIIQHQPATQTEPTEAEYAG